jgi:hypothetical protein
MCRERAVLVGLVVAVLVPGLARGQTVYSDGKSHTVSGSSGPIQIENNGTTLNVDTGATVSASYNVQDATAIVGGTGTTINMLGGTVAGLQNHVMVGNGITTYGFLSASGGLVSGGFSSGVGGATGAEIYGSALITGGAFQGGPGVGAVGGSGIYLTGTAEFLGGTVQGGIAVGTGSAPGAAMVTSASSSLSVYAGTFEGGVSASGSSQIFGGTFQGTIPNGSQPINNGVAFTEWFGSLSIAGGTFQGGGGSTAGSVGFGALEVHQTRMLSISGGTFQGGNSAPGLYGDAFGAQLNLNGNDLATISGGSFSAGTGTIGPRYSLELWDTGSSSVTVSGGVFSGPILLELDLGATASFVGTGLQFDSSTGMLTGTLADGSAIDDFIALGGNYRVSDGPDPGGGSGIITFNAAPEPSSIVILGVGAVAVAAVALIRSWRCRGAFSAPVA